MATLTTGTLGSRRVWGSSVLDGPRMLHVAAGVPTQSADSVLAQFPKLTLPTASASVGEGASLVEYATSTAGSLTMGRFGRFTDLSEESQIGADAGAIVAAHAVGLARDLDKALIDAINTEAGTAVAFAADVPAAIRKQLAIVQDNTAARAVDGLVIAAHPDNVALLEDVAPIGGDTIGEPFQRFSGAIVYPSSSVPTGFMLIGNLRAGVRFFEAAALRTATDVNIKTGVVTVATSWTAGFALGLVGAFVKVDVVTP